MQLGAGLARVEFVDDHGIEAINRYSGTTLPVRSTLLFEWHGMSQREVEERAELMQTLAAEHGSHDFQWKTDRAEREQLWRARHHAYFATRALRPGAEVLTTDVCVPVSRLAECMVDTRRDLAEVSFPATIVGHVGDGNFHVLCVVDPKIGAELEEVGRFSERIVGRALRMGGTCTGEHGVGSGKKKHLVDEHGPALDVMRTIKRALDPDNRMNPGKVLDVE